MLQNTLAPKGTVTAEIQALCAQLRHQLTLLTGTRASPAGQHSGLTIWSTEDGSASIYWHWKMSDLGTPVIANPLAIRSNLRFVQPGQEECAERQLLGINCLVHELPWQQEVMAHLSRLHPTRAAGTRKQVSRARRHSNNADRGAALAA